MGINLAMPKSSISFVIAHSGSGTVAIGISLDCSQLLKLTENKIIWSLTQQHWILTGACSMWFLIHT